VAQEAVRAVAARNPRGMQLLLDMVRTAPEAARRKHTRFGPLNVALMGQPVPPPHEILLCEAFAREWLRGDFDVHELGDAVETELARLTGRPQDPRRHRPDLWRTLAGPQKDPGRLFGPSNSRT
jgi:hypothetical protein